MIDGPTELVQNFAYRESRHRRKGAASPIIWFCYIARPSPVFYCSYENYLPSQRLQEGGRGGVSTLWSVHIFVYFIIQLEEKGCTNCTCMLSKKYGGGGALTDGIRGSET